MSLRAEIFKHEREHRTAGADHKAELKRRILALPDNPAVRPVSDNCFIGSFSSLRNNWSVEYHSFKMQYRLLARIVDKAESAFRAMIQLHRARVDGSIRVDANGSSYTVRLHPAVVEGLRRIAR